MISPSSSVNPYIPPTKTHEESEKYINTVLCANKLGYIVSLSSSNEDNHPWLYWYNQKALIALTKISSSLLAFNKENIIHSELQIDSLNDRIIEIKNCCTTSDVTKLCEEILPKVNELYSIIPQVNISSTDHGPPKLVGTGPYSPPTVDHARAEGYLDAIFKLANRSQITEKLDLQVNNKKIFWQNAYNFKLAQACLIVGCKTPGEDPFLSELSRLNFRLERAKNYGTDTIVKKHIEKLLSIDELYTVAMNKLKQCQDALLEKQISASDGRSISIDKDPSQENNEVKTEPSEESEGSQKKPRQMRIFTFHPDSVKKEEQSEEMRHEDVEM